MYPPPPVKGQRLGHRRQRGRRPTAGRTVISGRAPAREVLRSLRHLLTAPRTPITGLAIPLLTHTCCYSPATADEPVNPHTVVLPSAWETTAESSLPTCRPLPRPRHRPPPWCSRRGVVSVVNDRHASEVDCTWRGQ